MAMLASRLRRLPVFGEVSETRLLALEPWLQERTYRPNETVYSAGEACDGLHAILKGAAILRAERPGKPVGQGLSLGAGELLGEAELLDRGRRELTARAAGMAVLLHIPLDPLVGLAADEPGFAMALRGLVTRRRMVLARSLLSSTRKETRIWLDREVTLSLGNGREVHARLEDLSGGGACFASAPESWQVGSQVNFELGVEGRPNLLQARGVVRWRDEALVGIAFVSTGPIHRQQVDETLRVLGSSPAQLSS
jgi:CRP-like cAMP-binding protein